MDCIFCKIVNKEIPAYVIYEDEYILAVLDISQATTGHTLIISKEHFSNIYEMDAEYAGKVFERVPMLSRAIKEAFHPIGLNVLINTDKPLQSVFHFHIHLIPRYDYDTVKINFDNHGGSLSESTYIEILNEIKSKINT